jgi:hypothetical protein
MSNTEGNDHRIKFYFDIRCSVFDIHYSFPLSLSPVPCPLPLFRNFNEMNPVLKFLFLILAFPLLVSAQNNARPTGANPYVKKEYYANGKLKRITKTKVKVPRNIDLYNYFKKTTVTIHEYDSITSNKIFYSKRVTKVGIGGRHCYEYFFKTISYKPNGDRIRFEKSHCDKNKSMYKTYTNGKVDFIHIEKSKRRKR